MLKFAVVTRNSDLFNTICQCFDDGRVKCECFPDDVALSRAASREHHDAIFVDAASGINSARSVFANRACYGTGLAPLIVIGTFSNRDSIERAFSVGADDVVLSPIDPSELAARTNLALRRIHSNQPLMQDGHITLGLYRLDRKSGSVLIGDRVIRLTAREFALTWLLFSEVSKYVSRQHIAGAIWGNTEDTVRHPIEQHIYKLRKKLGLNGTFGVNLRTRYGHGYRVELSESATNGTTEKTAQAEVGHASDLALRNYDGKCDPPARRSHCQRAGPQIAHRLHAANAVCVECPAGAW
jgi:DNA-binding response OmpR family regulator